MTVVSNPNEYSVEGLVDTGSGNQRVIMTQSVNGTQQAYSETSVECIVEDGSGNKQRCVCVNDFGGGGGGGVTSVNGKTGEVTLGADDVLPSQTGNSGKYLTTDGTNSSWGSISALQNSATKNTSIVIGSLGGGNGEYSYGFGNNVVPSGQYSVCVGPYSWATGQESVSFGRNARNSNDATGCVSIGAQTSTQAARCIAVGYYATSTAQDAIQIGYGTNTIAKTLQIGFNNTNYQLLDGTNGLIPAARHATLPVSDGTYTLKLTISGGVPTLSWVAD